MILRESVFASPPVPIALSGLTRVLMYLGNILAFTIFFAGTVLSIMPWLLRPGASRNIEEEFAHAILFSFANAAFFTGMANLSVCYFVLLWTDSPAARTVMGLSMPVTVWSFPVVLLIALL